MAEENDSTENRPRSLDIIGRVLSSLTSNEEPTDSIEAANQNDDVAKENTNMQDLEAPETSDVNENEENTNEEPQRGSLKIFSSIFSSLTSDGSENDSEHSDVHSDSSNEENDRTEDISVQEFDDASSENPTENEEENTDKPRQRSLAMISDFFSSFTSSSTTETVEDEVQTAAEQNHNLDVAESESKPDECDISSDSNTKNDAEEQDRFHSRVRSSSSALYTQPDKIDKEDLDYVTLVSS